MSAWPRPETLGEAVRDCYALHAIVCQLGFEPDEVFVGVVTVANAAPAPALCVVAQLQRGDKIFTLCVRDVTLAEAKRFQEMWRTFCHDKPGISREELDALVHASPVWERKTELLWGLVAKGFDLEPGRMVS